MILARLIKNLVCLVIFSTCLYVLAGCTPTNYKKDADEKVYNIIDHKWRDEFGPKANYRISDVPPSPDDIQIEKVVPASGILKLPQAVAIATAHNRDYQTQKEKLYAKALDLRLIRHNFEKIYYGRVKGEYARVEGVDYVGVGAGIEPRFNPGRAGQRLPVDNNGQLRADRMNLDNGFGFDQLLTDGTMIGANVGLSWGRILSGTLRGESLISILSFEVTKPLLRGSDRRVVMESLTQAERDTLYQLRLFNRFRKTFVVSVISQYYKVLQAFDAVKNARRNYNTLDWLYERAEKLADAGRLPQFELDGIAQDKLIALDKYIEAEREYKLSLDRFKLTLGLPTTAEFQLDPNELEVLRTAELVEPDFAEDKAVETALSSRLDLVNSADAVTDAQRKVFVAADGLKAQLDLGVNSNIPLQDLSSPDAKVLQDLFLSGLQADLPFDRVAEQNIYRKALISLNQKQREYEQASDTVALEVRTAYRDWIETARRYKVQSEQLRLAQKRLNNTFSLMQYGRASSRRVLDAEKDLFNAQNAATEALIAYTVATLNFYCNTEVLGVRPDGMWEKRGMTDDGRWTMNGGGR
jgi:outer membrane protein TolC